MKRYYPIMLDITDKKCIVIGGGRVAVRKVTSLLAYNARITVISKSLCEGLKKLQPDIDWIERDYVPDDLDGAFIVFATTNDPIINQRVYNEAKVKDILVNVADDPDVCSFIVPSQVECGDLTIAISTNGKSPALAKKIREDLEKEYGDHYAVFVNLLGNIRRQSEHEISDSSTREALYKEIVYSDLLDKLKQGKKEQVKEEIQKLYEQYKSGER